MSARDALSIHRSFVVRVYPGLDLDAGQVAGRVEHVVSGEATEFASLEELFRFVRRVLGSRGPRSAS